MRGGVPSFEMKICPPEAVHARVAELAEEGNLLNCRQICPERPGSLAQPSFNASGDLFFIADWSDWWNLYRVSA